MLTKEVPETLHATIKAKLLTLGTLSLIGKQLTRPKPLLLLAYLAHEGPTDRERLARLFFASAQDSRDALSTTVRRLRGLVTQVGDSDPRLRTNVVTDAQEFELSALRSEPNVALAHYNGAFAQGMEVGMRSELEEWVMSTRERFASLARDLHLASARTGLRHRQLAGVWTHARAAVRMTETFSLDAVNTADLLRRLGSRGLPVPESWWKAIGGNLPERTQRGKRSELKASAHRRGVRGRSVKSLRLRPARRPGDLM